MMINDIASLQQETDNKFFAGAPPEYYVYLTEVPKEIGYRRMQEYFDDKVGNCDCTIKR